MQFSFHLKFILQVEHCILRTSCHNARVIYSHTIGSQRKGNDCKSNSTSMALFPFPASVLLIVLITMELNGPTDNLLMPRDVKLSL